MPGVAVGHPALLIVCLLGCTPMLAEQCVLCMVSPRVIWEFYFDAAVQLSRRACARSCAPDGVRFWPREDHPRGCFTRVKLLVH